MQHFTAALMCYFAAAQQTGTAKLLVDFVQFKKKEHADEDLMKLNLILERLSNVILLALELKVNQNLMKKLCFEFLSRILTCT